MTATSVQVMFAGFASVTPSPGAKDADAALASAPGVHRHGKDDTAKRNLETPLTMSGVPVKMQLRFPAPPVGRVSSFEVFSKAPQSEMRRHRRAGALLATFGILTVFAPRGADIRI